MPLRMKPLVLVVDDDQSVRRSLARLLRAAGHEAQTFASAGEFFAWTPPDRAACLVCDVKMPGPSGLDLQARLVETHPHIPILFITGHGDVPTSVRAMKGGAVDFLEKPFDEQALLDGVRRALARSRKARAEGADRKAIGQRLDLLTPREHEVLALVAAGLRNKEIAARLGTAEKTIKIHRSRMMEKMQAASIVDLIRMVEKVGIPAARV
jgi:FixJ family two-component response regulator